MSDNRKMSKLSTKVDEAIELYEKGYNFQAMKILSNEGFSLYEITRILKNPEQRRQYINDKITGY